jgi:hypothetical protein
VSAGPHWHPISSCIRLRIAPVLSLCPESQTVKHHRSTALPNSTCHSHPLWPLMATLPPLSPAPPQVHRADSSGSNIGAGSMIASLSRRPRTKSRPRAVTVSSRRDRSPASARGLEWPVATADELLGTTSLTPPSTASDPSPSLLPTRPPRSPLRAASLPKDDASHPDIVPGAGWKAMDDMESSWRSRALKIEHSTVSWPLFLALVKLYQRVFFLAPSSQARA